MSATRSYSSRGTRGWLIEKDRGSERHSPSKADDDAVWAKSRAGRSPPVTGGGLGVEGGGGGGAALPCLVERGQEKKW
jgi:hypothetical protein